jgi:redox-sensitive bicupin YhaK (pirin superfamily)
MSTAFSQLDVRRADQRFSTQLGWLDSKHSFAFGPHRSVENTHHGLLLVSNDDIIQPNTGFDTHPHRDMEIVTWVIQGSLVHQDSMGHSGIIYPGLAQRMSAGTGIFHSEKNDTWTDGSSAADQVVRLVQMWVVPDTPGVTPSYAQLEIEDGRLESGLVPVASGMAKHRGSTAIRIHNEFAALHVARLRTGQRVELPSAPFVHLFVAKGALELEGAGELTSGDAVRLTNAGGEALLATQPAEVLVWEMHAGLGR